MRGWIFAAPIAAAFTVLASTPALAQDAFGRGAYGAGASVVCESQNGAYRECGTPFRGRAVLVETLSGTACIEGRNWGSRRGSLWVNDGCRGRFADSAGGGAAAGDTVRCESNEGRYRECPLPGGGRGRGGATLVRQLSDSACVQGRSWGVRNGQLWVSDGCRGEFAASGQGWGGGQHGGGWNQPGQGVVCSSENQRHTVCPWNAGQGRPRLVEQLSEATCREGFSWGYQRGQIWVDRGCRGRFEGR